MPTPSHPTPPPRPQQQPPRPQQQPPRPQPQQPQQQQPHAPVAGVARPELDWRQAARPRTGAIRRRRNSGLTQGRRRTGISFPQVVLSPRPPSPLSLRARSALLRSPASGRLRRRHADSRRAARPRRLGRGAWPRNTTKRPISARPTRSPGSTRMRWRLAARSSAPGRRSKSRASCRPPSGSEAHELSRD